MGHYRYQIYVAVKTDARGEQFCTRLLIYISLNALKNADMKTKETIVILEKMMTVSPPS